SRPPRCVAPSPAASSMLSTGAPPPPKSASGLPPYALPVICCPEGVRGGLRRPRGLGPVREADGPWSTGGRTMSVTTHRRWVGLLGVAVLTLIPLATPAHALSACGGGSRGGGLAQLPGGRPLA